MIWLKAVMAIAILAAVSYVIYSYNEALREAERLKSKVQDLAAERDGWIQVVAEQEQAKLNAQRALMAREAERARLQRERDDARASLATLRRTDPVVAKWADIELPPAVIDRLRNLTAERPAAEANPRAAAGDAASARPSTTVRRLQERGPAGADR